MTLHLPSPLGHIDLHSHLLPGIDDGCTSVADSLACVRRLKQHGFVGTVCTPHIVLDLFPQNVPAAVADAVCVLQAEIDQAGLEYQLWPGGELRIDAETVNWIESVGVPTLGNSNVVLIDWWGNAWPDFAYDLCRYLLERNYRPILAHPERMGLQAAELESVLKTLQAMGVDLQGNLNSLSGGEGPLAAERARRLLIENRYHLLATDMHRPESLDGRMAGMSQAESLVGARQVTLLLDERPRQLVFGE